MHFLALSISIFMNLQEMDVSMALKVWLSENSRRYYPDSEAQQCRTLRIDTALNERSSFQVLLREDRPVPQKVSVSVQGPSGWQLRVRRVGYIPVAHLNTYSAPIADADVEGRNQIPGYVPDPLFDEQEMLLPGQETHAFWVSVRPGDDAVAGDYDLTVSITPEKGRVRKRHARLRLHPVRLEPRRNFNITHWFYADSIFAWYKLRPFSEEFWQLCEKFIANYADHGLDTLYVPAFTPPLDGVKLPTQLLKVQKTGSASYRFDWSDVKRWIGLARRYGITHFEWTHPFTQWGVEHAIRIYADQGQDETLLWPADTKATSDTYRAFLKQYLPELHRFLQQEGLLENSFFHVSDEPHGEAHLQNYRQARELLREIAPWMKTMDALTDITYGRLKITDMPVPSISTALSFIQEGLDCWCYYCCGPRGPYLNRLLDTPLAKIAMHGFLFYRWPFHGFLHWGYNYWFRSQTRELVDVYTCQDGGKWPGWAFGDTTMVYPGPDGPLDSIRWEIFAEALQDYRLLQTVNLDRNDKLLQALRSFADFPKHASWRRNARRRLLQSFNS